MKCGGAAALALSVFLLPSAGAQQSLVIRPLVEKKITKLPAGTLFWRIEAFPSMAQAQAASGPTGLVAEAEGRVWLFTLATRKGASHSGTRVADVGPVPHFAASEYLLRINEASGPPGSATPVHTHPGSEAFYVIFGQSSQRTPHGITRISAGHVLAGHNGNMPMQISSSGTTDLRSLVMFVVDATKPFSSPATFR